MAVTLAVAAEGPGSAVASGPGRTSSVPSTNQVAGSPNGGGYPVPPGQTYPSPGTCGPGTLDSSHSESWIAVKPGTEDLVGSSKFFFDKYSKFYNFYLGTYRILGGKPVGDNQVQGYRLRLDRNPGDAGELDGCDRSERRVRHQGPGLSDDAAVQRVLGGSTLRPDGAIDISYSDDMGQHRVKANGGQGPGAVPERPGQAGRSCRGQAVDRLPRRCTGCGPARACRRCPTWT
jgi:hypothetical protein